MNKVQLDLDKNGQGVFRVTNGEEQMGEMVVGITNSHLTVYHTEVATEAEGMGVAKMLMKSMVEHARKQHLIVVPLCPYVFAQFNRHPEEFADVWKNDDVKKN